MHSKRLGDGPVLAPAGHSALYVLVPTPNQSSSVAWGEERLAFKNHVLDLVEKRAGLPICGGGSARA
ncbi:MAG: hypothetical protein IPQ26_09625 [Elusimicrobia bacterium]|nr:hypothetical protein [Elusimicrobiota bacterium]